MKIAIASDHGGFQMKEQIKMLLDSMNVPYEDLGTNGTDAVDYPDYAAMVAKRVQSGNRGILCCGTGIGMSITANKFKGIRAALCHDEVTARLSREHNDANILVLGGRLAHTPEEIRQMVQAWVNTAYEGGRHEKRLEKIKLLEGKE